MYDIFHEWGNDLVVSSSGDLALALGASRISQRVCRRLLTNQGDYFWNLDYGGGLAQFVGVPADLADIEATVIIQLALETTVPMTPAPAVSVRIVDAAKGYFVANITYADPSSSVPVQLNVSAD